MSFSLNQVLMRVIAGLAKGRKLATPKSDNRTLSSSKGIRPVLDQVKEAIFNILFDVSGFRVLDLFAGTGAMGIEALSRGAAFAFFVDNSKEALKLIETNLKKCQFDNQAIVFGYNIPKAIAILEERKEIFDLIFIDPPYEENYVGKTLVWLAKSPLLQKNTLLIVEHHPKEPIGEIEGLRLTDQRKYGQTLVSFLKREER